MSLVLAFSKSVKTVARVIVELQVSRITASLVVWSWRTFMANVHAVWDFSFGQKPRNPVGSHGFVDVHYLTVTSSCLGSLPRPALIWTSNVNLAPKAFDYRGTQSLTAKVLSGYRDHVFDSRPLALLTRRAFYFVAKGYAKCKLPSMLIGSMVGG
jgi:hypothetical protein